MYAIKTLSAMHLGLTHYTTKTEQPPKFNGKRQETRRISNNI